LVGKNMKWQLNDILGLRLGESANVPWESMSVTLILIKQDGNVFVDRSTHKYQIIYKFAKGDLLLAGWHGQYRTDIFEMDGSILKKNKNYKWYLKKRPEEFKGE
jgi:hypothetical protein